MKTALFTMTALVVAAGAFAQGTVDFKNMISGTPTPFVYLGDGITKVPASVGSNYHAFAADLFYGPAGVTNPNKLTDLGLTVYFSTNPSQAGLFSSPSVVTVPWTSSGTAVTLQIRVWETYGDMFTSWAAFIESGWHLRAGEGNLVQVTLGTVPAPPPTMVGIQPITMHYPIPEPSSAAIAWLGLSVACIGRLARRQAKQDAGV